MIGLIGLSSCKKEEPEVYDVAQTQPSKDKDKEEEGGAEAPPGDDDDVVTPPDDDDDVVTPPDDDSQTPPAVTSRGWFELPIETEKAGDYYFAHHMRSDAPTKRNYSICYSADYHCAVWTAHIAHPSFNGSAGRNETWTWDPQIPQSVQPSLKSSYEGSYSRGHMVASGDRQISAATNRQTFYYTNMAPQIQNEFNGGIWNKLENRTQTTFNCSDTLYIVTGSHWENESRFCYDNSNKRVVVPTHFYKVLIRSKSGSSGKPLTALSASEIKCVVFWLPHDTSAGTKGDVSVKHLISVAEAERRTNITFFPNVPNAPKETFSASEWGF